MNVKLSKARCYRIPFPLVSGTPGLSWWGGGWQQPSFSFRIFQSGCILGRFYSGSLLSPLFTTLIQCMLVMSIKTTCEFFIPCAYVLCLSSVLRRSRLVLHKPRSDAPGRAKESVSLPCRQSASASVTFRSHLLLDTNWSSLFPAALHSLQKWSAGKWEITLCFVISRYLHCKWIYVSYSPFAPAAAHMERNVKVVYLGLDLTLHIWNVSDGFCTLKCIEDEFSGLGGIMLAGLAESVCMWHTEYRLSNICSHSSFQKMKGKKTNRFKTVSPGLFQEGYQILLLLPHLFLSFIFFFKFYFFPPSSLMFPLILFFFLFVFLIPSFLVADYCGH